MSGVGFAGGMILPPILEKLEVISGGKLCEKRALSEEDKWGPDVRSDSFGTGSLEKPGKRKLPPPTRV
jgi:hypothetical protein